MASVAMQQAARPTCRPRRALLCSVCRIRAAVRTAMGVVSWCMPPANLLQPSSGPGLALSETKSVPNPDTPLTTKQCWARALWQVGCCSRAVIRGFACSLRFSRAQLASGPAAAKRVFSEFIPSPQIDEITEPAAIDMFASYRFTDVTVAGYSQPVRTAFIGPQLKGSPPAAAAAASASPVLLLHGFDSSAVEFRRVFGKLSASLDTFALDVLGVGYTDMSQYERDASLPLGPEQIREHMYEFWRQEIGRPVTVVGASLGGTMALDFAYHYPEAVEKLVLIDAQGYIDGIGPAAKGPRWLAWAGAQLLRTVQLRESVNQIAYFDSKKFGTQTAMLVARLHTHCPGWSAAKVSFIKSGGYQGITLKMPDIKQPCLVMWGKQDKIIDPKYAEQFATDLPNARVQLFDDCGHVPHLEQSSDCAGHIIDFVMTPVPVA